MPSHILIAHDLRDTADMALCRATQLAKQFNAKLTILHVLDPSKSSQEHEQAKQALDRSLTQYAPPGSQLLIRTGINPRKWCCNSLMSWVATCWYSAAITSATIFSPAPASTALRATVRATAAGGA